MRGSLLGYDAARGEGVISGSDDRRYKFLGTEWKGDIAHVRAGMDVDYDIVGDVAVEVYPLSKQRPSSIRPTSYAQTPRDQSGHTKNKVTAGLLALVFGSLGIHKFYMGYDKQGGILLGVFVLSMATVEEDIGAVGILALAVIALIEGIILLSKSEAEFESVYLAGERPWF